MQFAKVKLSSLAIAAGLMVVAGAASAQAVTSGGASLPQPLYQDIITNGPITGTWSYASTGSGTGKTAFLTNNSALFSKTGTVHIVGSDSALSPTDITTYNSAYNNGASSTVANYGRLIQIPAEATAVLLPYKETGVSQLNLTTAQLCGIYSYGLTGTGRTWNQVATTADDGANGSTSPIAVVYRSESSGTTELLSRFLVANCNASLPAGKAFVVSSTFKTVVQGALPTLTSTNADGLPVEWVSTTGNSGGVAAAMNVDHRLGYLSPDPTYTGNSNALVSRVNSLLPTAASVQAAVATATPPATALARANPLNWVPAYAIPSGAYPIYGTTNLILGQCYAGGVGTGTAGAAVKDFVTKLNNGTYDAKIATHNFATLPPAWVTAIKDTFLTAGATLEIGSTAACNGIGR